MTRSMFITLLCIACNAWGQTAWRPEKAVELIVPTGPGANNDRMVRLMQKILQDQKPITPPVLAVNKPGGNQTLALTYLVQRGADPHALLLTNPAVFTNELAGVTQLSYTSVTPIALLLVETNAITVKARRQRSLVELSAQPRVCEISRGGISRGPCGDERAGPGEVGAALAFCSVTAS